MLQGAITVYSAIIAITNSITPYMFVEGLVYLEEISDETNKIFQVIKPVNGDYHLRNILRFFACKTGIELITFHLDRWLDGEIKTHDRDDLATREQIEDYIYEKYKTIRYSNDTLISTIK